MPQICKFLYRSLNHSFLYYIVANSTVVYVNTNYPNNLANRSLEISNKNTCKPNKLTEINTTFRRMTIKLLLGIRNRF